MDKKKASLIFAFSVLVFGFGFANAEPFEQPGDVATIDGRQHKILEINPDGSKKILMSSWERWIVSDYDGNRPIYTDYKITQTGSEAKIETPQGSVIFNKSFCSFSFYQPGFIAALEQPLFTDSLVAKKATVGSEAWSNVGQVNNEVCQPAITTNQTSVTLAATKQKPGVGVMKYEYIYSLGNWKTQLTATNLSPLNDQKFGFTQTIDLNRDSLKFGNQTVNLQNFNGTTFDRAWIENNEAKLLDLMNGINYDFDLAFDYLNKITVYAYANGKSKLVFDFTRNDTPFLSGQTMILDPTYSSTSGGLFSAIASNDNHAVGEYVKESSSVLNGITIDSVTWYLRKAGSPTGTGYTKIYNNAGTLLTTCAGSLDVTTLTGSSTAKTFTGCNHVTAEDHRIVFDVGSISAIPNYVEIEYANPGSFDTTNSILTNRNTADVWADTPTYDSYDTKFDIVYITTTPPNAPRDLTVSITGKTTADLSWTQPDLKGNTLIGYQGNKTTPTGNPQTIIFNSTTSTSYSVTGLAACSAHSFRIGIQGSQGYNGSGNIANATTLCFDPPAAPTLSAIALSDIALRFTSINGSTGDFNMFYYGVRCSLDGGPWITKVSNSSIPNPRVYEQGGLTLASVLICQWRDGSAAGFGPWSENATATPVLDVVQSQRSDTNDPVMKLKKWIDDKGGLYFGMGLFPFIILIIGAMATPRTTHIFTLIVLLAMGIIHAAGFFVYPAWYWSLAILFGIVLVFAKR